MFDIIENVANYLRSYLTDALSRLSDDWLQKYVIDKLTKKQNNNLSQIHSLADLDPEALFGIFYANWYDIADVMQIKGIEKNQKSLVLELKNYRDFYAHRVDSKDNDEERLRIALNIKKLFKILSIDIKMIPEIQEIIDNHGNITKLNSKIDKLQNNDLKQNTNDDKNMILLNVTSKEDFNQLFKNKFEQNHPQQTQMFKIFDIMQTNYQDIYWREWGESNLFCSNRIMPERISDNDNYYMLEFLINKKFIWMDIFFNREDDKFIKILKETIPGCERKLLKNLEKLEVINGKQKNLDPIGMICYYEVSNLKYKKLVSLSIKIDNANDLTCLFKSLEPLIKYVFSK